jgi:hypothetical protein
MQCKYNTIWVSRYWHSSLILSTHKAITNPDITPSLHHMLLEALIYASKIQYQWFFFWQVHAYLFIEYLKCRHCILAYNSIDSTFTWPVICKDVSLYILRINNEFASWITLCSVVGLEALTIRSNQNFKTLILQSVDFQWASIISFVTFLLLVAVEGNRRDFYFLHSF